jgi:hypothetical protein
LFKIVLEIFSDQEEKDEMKRKFNPGLIEDRRNEGFRRAPRSTRWEVG